MRTDAAVRAVTALWITTILTYWIQPQRSFAWINLAPEWQKWQWATLNLVLATIVLIWPRRREWIAIAAIASFITQMAWHSWLGAFPPWIPVFLAALAWFIEADRKELMGAIASSLLLVFIGTALHRMNAVYLHGVEFRPEGMFAKLFPPEIKSTLGAHSALSARTWLVVSLIPSVFLILKKPRWTAIALTIFGLVACALYSVLFYGFYLLVPMIWLAEPKALTNWKSGRHRALKPLHLYFLSMVGFFAWYLWVRDSRLVYTAVVCAGMFSLFASNAKWAELLTFPSQLSRKSQIWLVALAVYLLAPMFWTSVPAPFGATYFSGRTFRYPAEQWIESPASEPDCRSLRREYALRWGYRPRQPLAEEGPRCRVSVFR